MEEGNEGVCCEWCYVSFPPFPFVFSSLLYSLCLCKGASPNPLLMCCYPPYPPKPSCLASKLILGEKGKKTKKKRTLTLGLRKEEIPLWERRFQISIVSPSLCFLFFGGERKTERESPPSLVLCVLHAKQKNLMNKTKREKEKNASFPSSSSCRAQRWRVGMKKKKKTISEEKKPNAFFVVFSHMHMGEWDEDLRTEDMHKPKLITTKHQTNKQTIGEWCIWASWKERIICTAGSN